MPFVTSYNAGLGAPQIAPATVDDRAMYPIGTIIKGYDATQGEAEFIYLPGVAAVVLGDVVVYDLLPGAATIVRALSGTHLNSGRPVAVAMGAVVALKFGWFQISGVAVVSVLAGFVAGTKVWLSATAGNVANAAIAGCQLIGAIGSSAIGTPAANKAYVTICRPSVQTQIT